LKIEAVTRPSRQRRSALLVGLSVAVALVAAVLPVRASQADAVAFYQVGTPDLSIVKTGPTAPVLVGDTMTYTLDVANAGGLASNIVVTDSLPANVSFTSATFTNGTGTCTEAGGVVTCTITSLPGGGAASIEIETVVNDVPGNPTVPTLPSLPTQEAPGGTSPGPAFRSVAWTGNTSDIGPFIDVTASTGAITGPASISYTPTGALGVASPYNDLYTLGDPAGDTSLQILFNWDTTAEGGGTPAATDAGTAILIFDFNEPVVDPVLHIDRLGGQGGGFSNSSQLTLLDGLTLTELGGSGGFDTTVTTIQRRSGETGTSGIECGVAVNVGTGCGTVQINGTTSQVRFLLEAAPGTVEGAGGDGIEFIWDVEPVSDLQVEKAASDIVHLGGDTYTWTVTATNNGPNTNDNVVITDTLPAGVTLTGSATSGGTFAGGTWTIDPMASGQVETLTLTMTVPPGVAEAEFENVATIAGDYVDPDLSNNTAVSPVYTCPDDTFANISGIGSAADLDVDLSNNFDQTCTEVGASVIVEKLSTNGVDTFNFTGTNLDDPIPPLTTIAAGTAVDSGQLTVTTLGAAVTITETSPADWELLGIECTDNNAAITGNTGTFGAIRGTTVLVPGGNVVAGAEIVCTFTNELFPVIDLEKTAAAVTSGSFTAGTYTVTYQVTANNTGGGAGDYSFVDSPTPPAGMQVTSVTLSSADPAVTTAPTNGATTASVSTEPIAALSSEVWDVTVVYTITNPALVVGGPATCDEATGAGGFSNSITGDDDTTNNTACVDVPADPALSVDKPAPTSVDTDGSGDLSAGDVLTYTITATNDGPSTLTNVVVTDNLITPTGGTTPCASVAPLGTCTLIGTYTITAADVVAGQIVNEATADSAETPPVTDDNQRWGLISLRQRMLMRMPVVMCRLVTR